MFGIVGASWTSGVTGVLGMFILGSSYVGISGTSNCSGWELLKLSKKLSLLAKLVWLLLFSLSLASKNLKNLPEFNIVSSSLFSSGFSSWNEVSFLSKSLMSAFGFSWGVISLASTAILSISIKPGIGTLLIKDGGSISGILTTCSDSKLSLSLKSLFTS